MFLSDSMSILCLSNIDNKRGYIYEIVSIGEMVISSSSWSYTWKVVSEGGSIYNEWKKFEGDDMVKVS